RALPDGGRRVRHAVGIHREPENERRLDVWVAPIVTALRPLEKARLERAPRIGHRVDHAEVLRAYARRGRPQRARARDLVDLLHELLDLLVLLLELAV